MTTTVTHTTGSTRAHKGSTQTVGIAGPVVRDLVKACRLLGKRLDDRDVRFAGEQTQVGLAAHYGGYDRDRAATTDPTQDPLSRERGRRIDLSWELEVEGEPALVIVERMLAATGCTFRRGE